MNLSLLAMAVLVGACTWAFRFVPTKLNVAAQAPDGAIARFLAATGPAAIATLFVASVLPQIFVSQGPLILGTMTVLAVFFWRRSVVAATLAGSISYGAAFSVLPLF